MTSKLLLGAIIAIMSITSKTTYCSPIFVVGLLNDTHLQYERDFLKAYIATSAG